MSEFVSPQPDHHPDVFSILQPIQLSGQVLRNRLICSPISTNSGTDEGEVTPSTIDFYATMGNTGCGMVTVGAASVSPEGISTMNCLQVGARCFEPGLTSLARSIQGTGAVASLQIFHVGAQGNTAYTGQPVWGPSPYICPDIGITAKELTIPQIEEIEDNFVRAILSALNCGFDFVELHLAHGYLLHEFLSEHFNCRADSYGGSEENRLRFVGNILAKLRAQDASALARLGARISGNDFLPRGLTIERNRELIKLFDSDGTAYWCVSAGIYETASMKYVHMKKGDYWEYAKQLKQITNTPVIAQGGIRSLRQAGEIVRRGMSDMAGMAQALIADPMLVQKTLSGHEDQVVPCTECGRCRYIRRKTEWERKGKLTFDCIRPEGYHLLIANS